MASSSAAYRDASSLVRNEAGLLQEASCTGDSCPTLPNPLDCGEVEISGSRNGEACGRCFTTFFGHHVSREICGAAQGLALGCDDVTSFSDKASVGCGASQMAPTEEQEVDAEALRDQLLGQCTVYKRARIKDPASLPLTTVALAYERAVTAMKRIGERVIGGRPGDHPDFRLPVETLLDVMQREPLRNGIFGACLLDSLSGSTHELDTVFVREFVSEDILDMFVRQDGFRAVNTPLEKMAVYETSSRLKLGTRALEISESPFGVMRFSAFSYDEVMTQAPEETRDVVLGTLVPAAASYRASSLPQGMSPIVLDMNHNGVLTDPARRVRFDLNADGQLEEHGWIDAGDALLVFDRNRNGRIDDGSELFGDASPVLGERVAQDGFDALSDFDLNADAQFDATDAAYELFQLWFDDGNARVEPGELVALSRAGVTRIDLRAQTSSRFDLGGNHLALWSHFETSDGSSHAAVDVFFRAQPVD